VSDAEDGGSDESQSEGSSDETASRTTIRGATSKYHEDSEDLDGKLPDQPEEEEVESNAEMADGQHAGSDRTASLEGPGDGEGEQRQSGVNHGEEDGPNDDWFEVWPTSAAFQEALFQSTDMVETKPPFAATDEIVPSSIPEERELCLSPRPTGAIGAANLDGATEDEPMEDGVGLMGGEDSMEGVEPSQLTVDDGAGYLDDEDADVDVDEDEGEEMDEDEEMVGTSDADDASDSK
jgi:hypothetical protein